MIKTKSQFSVFSCKQIEDRLIFKCQIITRTVIIHLKSYAEVVVVSIASSSLAASS